MSDVAGMQPDGHGNGAQVHTDQCCADIEAGGGEILQGFDCCWSCKRLVCCCGKRSAGFRLWDDVDWCKAELFGC